MKEAFPLDLPKHLQAYIISQDYDKYTALEQATWRYILRQQSKLLGEKAHASFLNGLRKTGICLSRIPRIEEIDEHLQKFSWRAVCVRGFIPPLIFLEFQSRHIMPIARDIRTLKNVVYTSAPDIVHEAAGHAPFVARADFRKFLEKYALVATKSFFSREDMELYEAIRKVSDMKENKDYTDKDIAKAEKELDVCQKSITWISEANKLSRFYWWTAEYGLVGTTDEFQVFGAGLLSSIFESLSCFNNPPKKVPLTLDCIDTHYDITEPQPQLFVAKNFDQLTKLLTDFEKTLAFSTGGLQAIKTALKAELSVNIVLDHDLTMQGELVSFSHNEKQLNFLSWAHVELPDENLSFKIEPIQNYTLPLGWWKGVNKNPKNLKEQDLVAAGFEKGQKLKLTFNSGVELVGIIDDWYRNDKGNLEALSWSKVHVNTPNPLNQDFYYDHYVMLVGDQVSSVYPNYKRIKCKTPGDLVTTSPTRTKPYTTEEYKLFTFYQRVRDLRETKHSPKDFENQVRDVAEAYYQNYQHSWLLGVELVELAKKYYKEAWYKKDWVRDFVLPSLEQQGFSDEIKAFVQKGLEISHLDDHL